MDDTTLLVRSGLSAALAAAICLAASDLVFLAMGSTLGEALQWGAWLAGVALGTVWAGLYVGARVSGRGARRVLDGGAGV